VCRECSVKPRGAPLAGLARKRSTERTKKMVLITLIVRDVTSNAFMHYFRPTRYLFGGSRHAHFHVGITDTCK
jgi:hypothetical protein